MSDWWTDLPTPIRYLLMADNNIDLLMSLDPLQMTSENIDEIIAYHRRNRAAQQSGVKPAKDLGPKKELNLIDMGLKKAPEPFKRRF